MEIADFVSISVSTTKLNSSGDIWHVDIADEFSAIFKLAKHLMAPK